jgi:hypothetical protein
VGAQSSAGPSPPLPSGSCPDVVPSCLNTWLSSVPDCKDNTDFNCFCQSADFITDVYQCIASWESDSLIVQAAVYFLAGICAPHVGTNPAIVTACPSGVPIAPPPAAVVTPQPSQIVTTSYTTQTITSCPAGATVTAGGVATVLAAPSVLTVDVTLTTTVCPVCTQSASSQALPVQTLTVGSTTCTVPQVTFVTATNSGGPVVSLAQTAAATSPAGTSPAAPAATNPTSVSVAAANTATATYQPLQVTTNAAPGNAKAMGGWALALGALALAM